MVVDIGGGTTDIAVISLSGVVESASIKVAGDQFDEAVVKYIRRKHNVLIGERTAEQMKIEHRLRLSPAEEEVSMEIKGRCLMTGLPRVIHTFTPTEMLEAFEEPVQQILEAIHSVLERTPPELVARHLQQRHRHDRRRQPGLGLCPAGGGHGPGSRPRWRRMPSPAWPRAPARAWIILERYAGRHHQPEPPQTAECMIF